jgi:hypothetical protein
MCNSINESSVQSLGLGCTSHSSECGYVKSPKFIARIIGSCCGIDCQSQSTLFPLISNYWGGLCPPAPSPRFVADTDVIVIVLT